MRHLSAKARVIMLTLFLGAFAVLCISIARRGLPIEYLDTFGELAALSTLACLLPVHIPNQKAYHTLGNIFRYAGLFLLPLPWAMLICYSRIPADIYRRYKAKRSNTWLAPLWNTSVVVILSHSALFVLKHYGACPPRTLEGWLIFSILVFAAEAIQVVLVYAYRGMNERRTWRSMGIMLTPEGFTIDVLQAYFGVLLAMWWSTVPVVLPLAIILSVALYRVVKLSQDAAESSLDPKTQLYNPRYLESKLAQAIDQSLKRQRPTSLVFADLDHLRDINSAHGHLIGDLALCAAATVLREADGRGFVASRFGGEEFILLLPDIAKSDAASLAERLRAALESRGCPLPSGEILPVTMSLGVATCPDDATTNYDLIRAADHAMYHAKAAGRNRVVRAGEK